MLFSEAYCGSEPGLSFELFPPKTSKGERLLFENLAQLMDYGPQMVTCTYGAGGSTRAKTLDVLTRVVSEHQSAVAAHLTCVGSTKDQLREFVRDAMSRGVRNIVALRGDPPQGDKEFRPVEGGLRYANELVSLLRAEFPEMSLAVAGYPEKHVEATTLEVDLDNLKRKVDAGADVVITQLFYDNADFFRFRDLCQQKGISVPVVPGLLPVTNFKQVKRITSLCGARLPGTFLAQLESCGDDASSQFEAGVTHAARQTAELLAEGAPGIHFYVLNKAAATARILQDAWKR